MKHIEDTLKEFDSKSVANITKWGVGGNEKVEYIELQFVKDFLQKALEDIYQKGREDGVRGFAREWGNELKHDAINHSISYAIEDVDNLLQIKAEQYLQGDKDESN